MNTPHPATAAPSALLEGVAASAARPARSRRRRVLLWTALVVLLTVGQAALWWLTAQYDNARAQDDADAAAAAAAADVRRLMLADLHDLQRLSWRGRAALADAVALMPERRELVRIELRDAALAIERGHDSPFHADAFATLARKDIDVEAGLACTTARRLGAPTFSRSYFVPLGAGLGGEMIDLCLPLAGDQGPGGALVATLALVDVLERAIDAPALRRFEASLVEADGARIARVGTQRGRGVFTAERLVDLPGVTLPLRMDSVRASPGLVPNLATSLVFGLSIALASVVMLLARDVRRRALAERGLAEALAFRKAMEDSLVTGLRARDLRGRITYVNPAFCKMVGRDAAELIGSTTPPYWPPEHVDEYTRRQSVRLSGQAIQTEGFETLFMRRNGERFPVLIFEAPLVDADGRHTGWMSAVLDVSAQRRVEELSRQQQDKLQASARLATMGEMASLLSHELNQPLAAIASYASGTLNLLGAPGAAPPASAPDAATAQQIRQAVERMAQQAERAGRVIKGVHDFVRRREHVREQVDVDAIIEAAMPLMRLAARKSATRIEVDIAPDLPRVLCDHTMVEQVLLNLARNGIQAMEAHAPAGQRVLTLRARPASGRWVALSVVDRGPGISDDVARQLFTPFFTTKAEGMGMGLSLCRTVIEQHGGVLEHHAADGGSGTEFRFTLPAALPAPTTQTEPTDQEAA